MRILTPERVLLEIQYRRGARHGIRTKDLVEMITNEPSTINDERYLRQIVTNLRTAGFPILATPETGYYWPVNEAEIYANCKWLHGRAMTHLKMMSRLKKVGVPLLAGQLILPIPQMMPEIPEMEKAKGKEAEEQEAAILAAVPQQLYEMVQQYGARTGRSEEEILKMALATFLSHQGVNEAVQFVGEL
jgi:hypothetical protein